MCDLMVDRADNLPAMDRNGYSDPYVLISIDRRKETKQKTKVVKKCLSPVWNQVFKLKEEHFKSINDIICFDVFDYDFGVDHDVLGFAHFPLYKSILAPGQWHVTFGHVHDDAKTRSEIIVEINPSAELIAKYIDEAKVAAEETKVNEFARTKGYWYLFIGGMYASSHSIQ